MKITGFKMYQVPPRWLFLKIETDEGIYGWGEPVLEGKADTVAACVDEMMDYLIGREPRQIEDIWQVLYRGAFIGAAVFFAALFRGSSRRYGISRENFTTCRYMNFWAEFAGNILRFIAGSAVTGPQMWERLLSVNRNWDSGR